MNPQEKIASLKEKMQNTERGSDMYLAYADIVNELEKVVLRGGGVSIVERPKIVVHKANEPEICESCQ